jgi:UTP--glucose-1-phosphate uridylyltransferase
MLVKKKLQKINKAVIAAAGYGTRFLPATKNQPKEMLPIIDRPIIHYLVEEAVNSGISEIIIVTRAGQGIMEDYFDSHIELEHMLDLNGKTELLERVKRIPLLANFIYVRQKKNYPYGNGTPLLTVKDLIDKGERFVYMFGDDLVLAETPCTKQIMEYSDKKDGSAVAAVQEVAKDEVNRYGIYKLKPHTKDRAIELIEKPNPDETPSRLAQFGRFILNHKIIDILESNYKENKLGKDNELWLSDAINEYAKKKPMYVARVKGEWMTTGDPFRYMKTQVRYALQREDIGEDFANFLKELKLEQ